CFPVEINTADYYSLLRVPGIGAKSAMKIIQARRFAKIDFFELKKMGIVVKRAQYFITCKGKHFGIKSMDQVLLRKTLVPGPQKSNYQQISFFDLAPEESRPLQIGG
ncbi:MAG: biotin synthase, partial [Tissierellia bacterium]|nr:biotin synthase [Tissierellia bacterium]